MSVATRADWSASAPFRFAVGIEDTFIAQEYPGRRKLDEYELTQHYQFWEQDLHLVASCGADSLRWGIPWYRVEPEPGHFTWGWVDRVVGRMSELGLTCIVDLMHYGTPLWLENSFLHPDYPQRVAEYGAKVAERYGDRLHVWTPLNEPVINAVYCGHRGLWPPHLTGDSGFTTVLLRLAEGICRTQHAIRSLQADASFVHVEAGFRYEGRPVGLAVLEERRFLATDLVTGRVCDDHPLWGWLLSHGAEEHRLAWLRENAAIPDVLGINYYPAFTTVRFEDGVERPVEAGAAGLADLVELYHDRFGLPLMITETSRGGSVDERHEWLTQSLDTAAGLRARGIPLLGYTWFPFLALVDWLYRESTTPMAQWLVQMGLVDLAPEPGGLALQRQPTELIELFRAATRRGMPAVPISKEPS
jgi:beta-glucosidase